MATTLAYPITLFHQNSETMQYITTSCRALNLVEYIHRHNDAAKIVLQEFAIKCGLSKG